MFTGCRKWRLSTAAVTTPRRAWRIAAMAPARSTRCITVPPSTWPQPLASLGSASWEYSEADSRTGLPCMALYYMGWPATNTAGALMSDRQVDARSKNEGDFVFSTTGKPPGNNHHKYGGNFLFCDGRIESTPPQLSFPLAVTPGIVLLNPKP